MLCGASAENGCCGPPSVGAADGIADPGEGSEHRVNDTEQSHLR